MICPKCGYEQAIYDDINEWWHCPQCHGTGEIEMTNDEWRKTCSMEEYATWLWKNIDHGEVIVLWEKYGRPMHKDNNGISRADYTEVMKKWLKQQHAVE